ncbi:MAG: MATE family efflux transporter [Erysipelotrichaceae bacterium]
MKNHINLLEGNITRSITKLAVPIMAMSFLHMAYNLTDIFWIGKLGVGAVASVGTGGLLIWFSSGIHMLSQVGGQVYVGQSLGSKNYKLAGKYAHASLVMSAIITLTLGLVYFLFTDHIVAFFQLNDAEVILNAKYYIQITGGLIFFSLLSKLLTTLITTTGNSKTPLYATITGLTFNMILDPILIFGLFGAPKLGVVGAAIATVIAQVIVFVFLVSYTLKDKYLFSYVKLFSKPELAMCKDILKLSFPAALHNTLTPFISMYISRKVAGFGDSAVGVQRVGSQIESISWMTADGFAIAVNSFIAQNYGANNLKRASEGYFKSLRIIIGYGLLISCLLIIGAKPIFSMFLNETEAVIMGVEYLQILGLSQVFICIDIISSQSLYALKKSTIPSVISVVFTSSRVPLTIILSATFLGLSGIWWSLTVTSIIKGVLSTSIIILIFKRLLAKNGKMIKQ